MTFNRHRFQQRLARHEVSSRLSGARPFADDIRHAAALKVIEAMRHAVSEPARRRAALERDRMLDFLKNPEIMPILSQACIDAAGPFADRWARSETRISVLMWGDDPDNREPAIHVSGYQFKYALPYKDLARAALSLSGKRSLPALSRCGVLETVLAIREVSPESKITLADMTDHAPAKAPHDRERDEDFKAVMLHTNIGGRRHIRLEILRDTGARLGKMPSVRGHVLEPRPHLTKNGASTFRRDFFLKGDDIDAQYGPEIPTLDGFTALLKDLANADPARPSGAIARKQLPKPVPW